ncbi:zf-HC2 domain-containing protein [Pseudonocardia nigra]|uniref:zf-HC2 domain-containing protein n=1 Tax=Pseudonocardia nigra TaxID=1921578 RepID=UPI001C6010B7|nr:zf-HC2 domain-containing protein [Pseudonocardia nigra]
MSLWSRIRYTLCCSPIARSRCRRALRLLQEHLDGRIDVASADELRQHLDHCRQCGLEADLLTRIKASLARQGQVPDASVRRLEEFAARLPTGTVPPDPTPPPDVSAT